MDRSVLLTAILTLKCYGCAGGLDIEDAQALRNLARITVVDT